MREIELIIPASRSDATIIHAIDYACREFGLSPISKGSLSKYPGCTHWHYKLDSQPGTLELTYWPKAERAWFSLRDNRRAPWMDALLPQLKEDIERWLIATRSELRA